MTRRDRPRLTAPVAVLAALAAATLWAEPAAAWWFFNKGKAAVDAADDAGKKRASYYDKLADPTATDAQIDAAKTAADTATKDALKKTTEFGTSVPGTSITGPPPTSVKGGIWQALKETLKWLISSTTDRPGPSDAQLAAAMPESGVLVADQTSSYLDFDYGTDSRMAPVLFGTAQFTASLSTLVIDGTSFGVAELAALPAPDRALAALSGDAVVAGLTGEIAATSPSWDPFDHLSDPAAYRAVFEVEFTSFDPGEDAIGGRLFYLAVGPFAEIAEPGTLAVLAGAGCIFVLARRRPAGRSPGTIVA
ncbi:MAG: hypothetical protein JNK67_27115 [Alphaproteobacteria bacterium]|nr:hypothetical protein [Alphaproteobacteria bacterium]